MSRVRAVGSNGEKCQPFALLSNYCFPVRANPPPIHCCIEPGMCFAHFEAIAFLRLRAAPPVLVGSIPRTVCRRRKVEDARGSGPVEPPAPGIVAVEVQFNLVASVCHGLSKSRTTCNRITVLGKGRRTLEPGTSRLKSTARRRFGSFRDRESKMVTRFPPPQ